MKITFTPMRLDDRLELGREGGSLIVNGERFDFSALREGDVLRRDEVGCPWLASDVSRTDGAITLSLILPHGARAPRETLYPEPIIITDDGPVSLPPHDAASGV